MRAMPAWNSLFRVHARILRQDLGDNSGLADRIQGLYGRMDSYRSSYEKPSSRHFDQQPYRFLHSRLNKSKTLQQGLHQMLWSRSRPSSLEVSMEATLSPQKTGNYGPIPQRKTKHPDNVTVGSWGSDSGRPRLRKD